MPLGAAVKNLLLCQPITADTLLAAAYAAIEAVVLAMIGEFDEATHEYLVAIDTLRLVVGALVEVLDGLVVVGGEDGGEFLQGNVAMEGDMVNG